MQQRNVTNFVTSLARFKFNGDGFQICNTEDDRCTVETCLENQLKLKKVVMFMRLCAYRG